MPPFIHRKLQEESGAADEVPSGGLRVEVLLGTDWLLLVIKGIRGTCTTPAGETLGGVCVEDFGMAVADIRRSAKEGFIMSCSLYKHNSAHWSPPQNYPC